MIICTVYVKKLDHLQNISQQKKPRHDRNVNKCMKRKVVISAQLHMFISTFSNECGLNEHMFHNADSISNQLVWSSDLLFLFLTSELASVPSDSSDWGSTLVLSSPLSSVCGVCMIWSLGRFQDGWVEIQRIRAPKHTRRTPRTFTKVASGGESLYFGLFLCYDKQKGSYRPCL